MAISEATRRAIVDEFGTRNLDWSGRLSEPDFLARIYNMEELPSKDYRFRTAGGDVHQHRVNNSDWEDDWVFYDDRFGLLHGDDDTFLRFLAETVHPAVRRDPDQAEELVEMYNEYLRADGYVLVEVKQMSARPVFEGRSQDSVPKTLRKVEQAVRAGDRAYISQQIGRMEASIESDPELAIGTAKELVETCCRTILEEMGVAVDKDWDVPRLVKETSARLKLTPDSVRDSTRGAETVRRLLGNLGSIAGAMAELRNLYGTGHGKAVGRRGLTPRHARLAVAAASTLAMFLFETYEERTT